MKEAEILRMFDDGVSLVTIAARAHMYFSDILNILYRNGRVP